MDPRYAFFIWCSFGVAAIAVGWNIVSPRLARNQLRQRLSERADDPEEQSEA